VVVRSSDDRLDGDGGSDNLVRGLLGLCLFLDDGCGDNDLLLGELVLLRGRVGLGRR